MTVSKDEQFVYNWFGDGKNTTFDFDFLIENESQLAVYFTNTETSQIKLENGIDYTINEIGNENGSFITFPIEGSKYHILKHDEIISISLELPISQDTPYDESEKLVKSRLERNFDYLTKLIAIQSKQIERAVKIREGSQYNPNEVLSIIFESEEKSKLAKENSQVALDSANLAKDIATAAQNQSDFAIETAQNSNNTALMANENSTTALTNANQSLNIAINANQESQEAMDLANLALESAENSNSKVDSFRIETTNQIDDFKSATNQSIEDFKEEHADDVSAFKSSINSQVVEIDSKVNTGLSAAQSAETKASNAVTTANNANTKADNAVNTANTASNNASNALTTANEAKTESQNATTTANGAVQIANTAAQKVDEFGQDIQAVIDAAGQIAQLEESVATAVNASSAATTAASEASTAAINATTAANNATQAVEDALEATQRIENSLSIKADSKDLTAHTSNKSNPHEVTKGQLGLGNVDNTSDINKPISNAVQTVLNNKLDINGTAVKATADGSGNNIINTYLTKSSASNTYAAKSSSLAGYGITNAYTKTEVDELLEDVASSTKTDIENIATDLNGKVDVSSMVDISDAGEVVSDMLMPDISSTIKITLPYTAPCDGWLWATIDGTLNGYNGIKVESGNGTFSIIATANAQTGYATAMAPVPKGAVLTQLVQSGTISRYFIPVKGVN